MTDFEKKYQKFKIDEELVNHLVKLSSKKFPFDEVSIKIPVQTIWSENGRQKKIEKEVAHAKLV